MPATITRSAECGNSSKNARVEDIALALMGAGALDDGLLADGAVWDRGGAPPAVGRDAIMAALPTLAEDDWIEVTDVVSHGRAGSVTGRRGRAGGPARLFCHIIRFHTAAARAIAAIVSFERPEPMQGGTHG